jgi:hypothetical protein
MNVILLCYLVPFNRTSSTKRKISQEIMQREYNITDGNETTGNLQMRVSCTFAETETLLYKERIDLMGPGMEQNKTARRKCRRQWVKSEW